MKLYVKILAFILLSYCSQAAQIDIHPLTTPKAEVAFTGTNIQSSHKKTSLKERLLQKIVTKKLEKLQRKTSDKKNDRPIHATNWLSFGSAFGSWILGAAGANLFLPLTIAAIVFGIIGINKSGTNKDYSGEGLGVTGLAIGAFNIIIIGLVLVVLLSLGG